MGLGGPGGWYILDEPELHLGEEILVPDLAGWRRERMPRLWVLLGSRHLVFKALGYFRFEANTPANAPTAVDPRATTDWGTSFPIMAMKTEPIIAATATNARDHATTR